MFRDIDNVLMCFQMRNNLLKATFSIIYSDFMMYISPCRNRLGPALLSLHNKATSGQHAQCNRTTDENVYFGRLTEAQF